MFVDVRQRAVAIGVWATMFALDMAAGVGVALLGSLSTALYSARMAADLTVTSPAVDGYVTDSLAGALSATDRIPLELLRAAREAFTTGVNIASAVAGGIVVAAVVLCLVALRHVRPLGEQHVAADHDLLEYPGADGRHHGRRRE